MREVCDRHGILLILDEVMCGMGRTGTLHACEQEGVVPDLITIAKGLGGGYQPIGAVLAQTKIVEAMSQGSGFFQHGHTYLGHPVACAAALAVQQVIQRDGLLAKVRDDGVALRRDAARRAWARIRTWATSAAAASSGASSWWTTARRKTPFDPALQAARAHQEARRWRAACCATRWAAPSTAGRATTCCWRRPSSPRAHDLQEIAARLADIDRRGHAGRAALR